MSNCYTHVNVTPPIPLKDTTALERFILGLLFECVPVRDVVLLQSEGNGINSELACNKDDLEHAMQDNPDLTSAAHTFAAEAIESSDEDGNIEITLEDDFYIKILQDIIKRSKTLVCITVEMAFTADRLRDGIGGGVALITEDKSFMKTTNDLLDEFAETAGIKIL